MNKRKNVSDLICVFFTEQQQELVHEARKTRIHSGRNISEYKCIIQDYKRLATGI